MQHFVQAVSAGLHSNRSDATHRAEQAARQLYRQAYTLNWLGRLWAALTRQSSHLLNLTEVEAAAARNHYSAGLQEVPIDRIRGSQGRCPDFDRNFCPLQAHLKERWLRVATAWYLGLALPPVKLIQVGDIYFVRDGHHRISVARALGQLEITAEVRVWQAQPEK